MSRRPALAFVAALVAVALQAAPTHAQQKLVSFAAGPVVGTFYVVLSSYAKVIHDELKVNTNVEVTGGPTNNVQLIHGAKAEFGLSTMAPIFEGYHGTGWAQGTKYDKIRTVLPTFNSHFQFYTFKDKGITKAKDVAGKRISAGSTASTPALFSKRVFEVLGGPPSAITTGSYEDLNNQLRDGLVDAGFTVAGIPHPAINELSARREMVVFGFDAAETKKIQATYPYLASCAIPANSYKGQTRDEPTVCLWNAIIANKDLSEELVYNFTKTIFANKKRLVEAHKSAEDLDPKMVSVMATPIHKGAARYYREIGIGVPEAAKPID